MGAAAGESHSRAAAEALPAPPGCSTTALPLAEGSEARMQCPLCRAAVRVPAVLPCAGTIACLPCLKDAVQRTGRCPWTRARVQPADVVQLYLEA